MQSRFFENSFSRSVGIHLLLLLIAFFYVTRFPPKLAAIQPIDVSFIDRVQKIPEAVTEPKKKELEDNAKQVVARSEGELAELAKKNSYLSDKTRVVKEERSAKNSGELASKHLTPMPKMEEPAKPLAPAEKPVALADLGVKIVPMQKKDFQQDRNWAPPATGEAIKGGQYIAGMREGESSALNTKEYVFFSFFDRVRKQLDQAWGPMVRTNIAHIYKVGRRLASNTDFTTRTLVTMNQSGEVIKVQVLEDSGTHDLDQAAIDALNKAGPYPHPPRGLIDPQGLVQIRWDFILKT